MTKRIAFLKSGIAKRGGLEKYTLRLAERFAREGHDVVLLTTDYQEGALGQLPFAVVNLGSRLPISLAHLLYFDLQCKKYIKEHPMDLVFGLDRNFCRQTHYRAGNGVHAAYLERRKAGGMLQRWSLTANPLHRLILAMERATFESPDLQCLFTNSHMVAKEIAQYYPRVDPKKICTVHNGVEWKELEQPFVEGLAKRSEICAQLGLRQDCFQFLFIGHEYGRKGLHLLLRALSLITNKNFELSVVGKERHPEVYIAEAKKLGLEKQVHFFGLAKDTKPFYSAADCLVVPSLYDPFANVTVEALAFGVPVISSSSNGGSEVLAFSDMGAVFSDLQSPEELASCLERAMESPKNGERARALRDKVAHLDFSSQIGKIVSASL
ncbi:MAG: glycosyltransferase family 4 protein [Verrucomicrobia bacterium]|nr:glycosyltransferase family 4 protein [Verrucomicrobiota bacterium]